MSLLERLFPPARPARDIIPLDALKEEAEQKRNEAEEAIRRYAPEVQRQVDLDEVRRRDGPAQAIRDSQRRINEGGR